MYRAYSLKAIRMRSNLALASIITNDTNTEKTRKGFVLIITAYTSE
jgi:hypothetical protein